MTQEEYIKTHPEQFKDDIDKWLFTDFGIIGGCCSAEKSHEYHIARMVAERYEQNRLAHCDELTPEQAQTESNFVVQHLKSNKRTPTFIDAIEYGWTKAIEKACEWLKENKYHAFIGCEDTCLSGYLTDEFIEDFKNYMKEE